MARRKKKSRSKSGNAGGTTAVGERHQSDERGPAAFAPAIPSRTRWKLAIVAALSWIAGLALLAIWTANRPMLNQAQIQQADLIVTGRVVDRVAGTVSIEKVWKQSAAVKPDVENRRITVRNLSETKAGGATIWLLPLTRVGGDTLEITRPKLKRQQLTDAELERPPRVYPASAEAVEQLRGMLED